MAAPSPAIDPCFLVVDGLHSASVAHGLARITLAQAGPDGEPVPAGRIAVPISRLPAVAGGFVALLRKLEEAGRSAEKGSQPASEGSALTSGARELETAAP